LKGCRYIVEGFTADRDGFVADRVDGVYEWEEHTHNKIIVPSFINKTKKVRISWNPHKKQWTARGTKDHKLFATLTAKPNAEWLDELESRRWQEYGFGRIDQVTVTREDAPAEMTDTGWGGTTLPPLSATGHTTVAGSGAGSDGEDDGECKTPGDEDALVAAFALFDTDGSGFLDETEFRYIMSLSQPGSSEADYKDGIRLPLDDAEVQSVFAAVDTDGSGNISIEEYLAWATPTEKHSPGLAAASSMPGAAAAADGLDVDDGSSPISASLDREEDEASLAGQVDDGEDSGDDLDEEEPKRCCLVVCCAALCMSFHKKMGRYLEATPAGEWLVEGALDLALGDYFAWFRYSGRLYWVYMQIKMLILVISVVFLGPFPIVQAGMFLFCEIVHLVAMLWVMPFINYMNHCAAVISSVLTIILYISFVGLGSAADPSSYSSLYVFIMMLILLQALVTQLWPVLVIIGQVFTFMVMALDMTALAGGEEVAPSESQVTSKRAISRMTLSNVKSSRAPKPTLP
jgi:hypothetical protein